MVCQLKSRHYNLFFSTIYLYKFITLFFKFLYRSRGSREPSQRVQNRSQSGQTMKNPKNRKYRKKKPKKSKNPQNLQKNRVCDHTNELFAYKNQQTKQPFLSMGSRKKIWKHILKLYLIFKNQQISIIIW